MSAERRVRWLLWLALVTAAPVPLAVVGRGWMPAGAMAQLAGVTLAVGVVERVDGIVRTLGGFLAMQAAVWAAIAWGTAAVLARGLARLGPRRCRWATAIILVGGLGAACVLPVYGSPFHGRRARQTLLEVYR